MTNSGTGSGQGAPSGSQTGETINLSHPYNLPVFERRLADDSKDRDSQRQIEEDDRQSKRKIEEDEASAQRIIKKSLVKATIVITIGVSILGAIITFGHQDSKVRELGVAVISAPIAGLFGVLAGMGLK